MNVEPARVDSREAEVLAVARALVTSDSYSSIAATLAGSLTVTKIGPTAMRVLTDTLAKGVVKVLARLGGARPRILADTGSTKPARVFDVRADPEIAFSSYAFELVRWLANTSLIKYESAERFASTAQTIGDEICAYLALRLVDGTPCAPMVASSPGLRTPLTWLGFTRTLARHLRRTVHVSPMASLFATDGSRTVLECLSDDLARRWAASATWDVSELLDAEHALRIVLLERAAVDAYLDAVEESGRWDLATFLIDAAARVLPPGATPRAVAARVAPRVKAEGTLRARTESRQHAGAIFHALGRLGRKRDELALVHFIDEGYDVAQATLSSWEVLGRDGFVRAANVVSSLASLDDLTVPESSRED